jgi:hypothetical protein
VTGVRERIRTCLLVACLLGLATLEYGWIIYPPLGTVAALIHLAVFLTILIAACIGRKATNTALLDRILKAKRSGLNVIKEFGTLSEE